MSLLPTAQSYHAAGLCVLPAIRAEKRPALPSWKHYQDQVPTAQELAHWFGDPDADSLCVLTGHASNNLEVIDFDAAGEKFPVWCAQVQQQMPELYAGLVMERTPSGGYHVFYRSAEPIGGSVPLAARAVTLKSAEEVILCGHTYRPRQVGDHYEVKLTLIETRGEGGLCLCAPTPGYELIQGQFENLPVLSVAEREALLSLAWDENEYWPVPEPVPCLPGNSSFSLRPGDDFQERGDVRSILQQHGWKLVKQGDNEWWRRPGKQQGHSATLKNGVLYVFSSSAAPFEPQRGYSKFQVYTLLEHGGDYSAAARALGAEGYGAAAQAASGTSGEAAPDLSKFHVGKTPADKTIELLVRRLSDVERRVLVWLWPGRVPLGKLTLLAGDPGLGKSYVTLDIAARVTRGDAWPDAPLLKQTAGGVILFNAEDDVEDTIAPRLDKVAADDRFVHVVEGIRIGNKRQPFSLETDLPRLATLLDEHPGIRLVVIDPIGAYCGKIDSHNNTEVRGLLAPLAELAGHYQVAVLAVTHLSKTGGSKAVYRAMGSLAFAAAARAVWAIVKDPEDPERRLFLPAKLNLARSPDGLAYRIIEGGVAWEYEPVKMHADDAMAAELVPPKRGGNRATERQEAAKWLLTMLAPAPRASQEILEQGEQYGFNKRTLQRAFKDLGGHSTKDNFSKGWLWSLPFAGDPATPLLCPEDDNWTLATPDLSSSYSQLT